MLVISKGCEDYKHFANQNYSEDDGCDTDEWQVNPEKSFLPSESSFNSCLHTSSFCNDKLYTFTVIVQVILSEIEKNFKL